MNSFMISTRRQLLSGWSNQGE